MLPKLPVATLQITVLELTENLNKKTYVILHHLERSQNHALAKAPTNTTILNFQRVHYRF